MKEFKYFSKRSCKCFQYLLISFAVDFPNITLPEWSSRPSRSLLRKVCILVILPVSKPLSILNLATTIIFSKKSSKYHLTIFLRGEVVCQNTEPNYFVTSCVNVAISGKVLCWYLINLQCPSKKWIQSIPLDVKLPFLGFFNGWFSSI